MFASDFPHENNIAKVKEDIREFLEFEGLDDAARDKILSRNAESFYQIRV
jgi:predicted TIM-barrel fold metal-dependent hydrolase